MGTKLTGTAPHANSPVAVKNPLEARLRAVVQRGKVLVAPAQLVAYESDGLGFKHYPPDAVVLPADGDELRAALRVAQELGVPATLRGAGTSLSGGPVAAQGGVVIHTSALRKIVQIDSAGLWCEVECSVTLEQLERALAPLGLFYPPDPSSGPVCTLGGNVAMNAGGARCFRYGVTSNYVLGLEAILLDGTIQRFGGPGGGRGSWREDWRRLLVGSEGTLAAFTRFWLRLLPRPTHACTWRATFADLPTVERAIQALSAHPACPVAIELMDPRCVAMVENSPMAVGLPRDVFLLITELDGPPDLLAHRVASITLLLREAGALQVEQSDDPRERARLWKARKVAGGLAGQLSPDFLVQDAVIPKRYLAELLKQVYDEADAAGLAVVNVFHAGDGNLHPNFLFDARRPGELAKVEAISHRLMQRVMEVGGTLSGEHGIGNDKTAHMPHFFGADTLQLQLAVPQVFNPRHQLNPLKVFASRRFGDSPSAPSRHDSSHADKEAFHQAGPMAERELFSPLLDTVDGVLVCSARCSPAEVREQLSGSNLRFPLSLDSHTPLAIQLAASSHAAGSSRFGPWCDNILGMNWRLPDGRIVRLGERVVKSTTGYDLLRFFLASAGRFGEPVDLVLRLRPDTGCTTIFWCTAAQSWVLTKLAATLLHSGWLHWCDVIDLHYAPREDAPSEHAPSEGAAAANASSDIGRTMYAPNIESRLCVSLHAPPDEANLFARFLKAYAEKEEIAISTTANEPVPLAGLPDFVLKTTPDLVGPWASAIASRWPVRCVALCYPGVVHGYGNPGADAALIAGEVEAHFASAVAQLGGEFHSRLLPQRPLQSPEREWITSLECGMGWGIR